MTIFWNMAKAAPSFVYNPFAMSIGMHAPFGLFGSSAYFAQNYLRKLPIFTVPSPVRHAIKRSTNPVSINTKIQDNDFWKKLGYNAQKGLELAKQAVSHVVGFIGYCARYVKNAIARTGLGKYESGHAYQQISNLRNNKNFKEISPNGVNLKSLPAGCVLVYDKGVSGYSKSYGHIEITTGTGKAVSDGVTNNLRKPTAIFIPV